jgi:hypothetical protein
VAMRDAKDGEKDDWLQAAAANGGSTRTGDRTVGSEYRGVAWQERPMQKDQRAGAEASSTREVDPWRLAAAAHKQVDAGDCSRVRR